MTDPLGHRSRRDEGVEVFAARVRSLRAERGWSLADVAAATGLSRAYLSRLELGQRQPTLAVLLALGRAFGVSVGELVDVAPESRVYRRQAEVKWDVANDVDGNGFPGGEAVLAWGSGAFEDRYAVDDRLAEQGLNPEELVAAAQASCAAMSLGSLLWRSGHRPSRVQARVRLDLEHFGAGSATIRRIFVQLDAEVPGIDEATFAAVVRAVKRHSPVAKALSGVEIVFEPRLIGAPSK